MIRVSAFETTKTIQEQVALISGSVAASEAALVRHPDRLSILPQEILLEIFSVLPTFRDKGCFVLTSRYLHQIFDKYLYATLGWLPVFLAARQGNIATLNKCKKLGAPADIFWDSKHDSKACVSPKIRHGMSQLEEAIINDQEEAVEWLLAQGTNPNKHYGYCSPFYGAYWGRENAIVCLYANQGRTGPYRYSNLTDDELRGQVEKAKRIFGLLQDAGAVPSREEATLFAPNLGSDLSECG